MGGGEAEKTAGEEEDEELLGGDWVGRERGVHYQPLVIENAFHICLQRFAFWIRAC